MEIDILSLFPDYFASPLQATILGRAIKQGVLSVRSRDIREFGLGKWKQVDDAPYGGEGMLLMAENSDSKRVSGMAAQLILI